MNELGRQTYLTSMGVDSYIPRMLLPDAPVPFLCELPIADDVPPVQITEEVATIRENPFSKKDVAAQSVQDIFSTMGLKEKVVKPSLPQSKSIAENTTQLQNSINIDPFVLTVWRPREDFLIVDSCKKGAALPTHLLLQNILRFFIGKDIFIGVGDRVQFPLINNIHGGNTKAQLNDSLQTWFAAEYEKRPSPNVWLMGENTVQYILPKEDTYQDSEWKDQLFEIPNNSPNPLTFKAKVLPSLSDILLAPELKAKLLAHL